MLYREAGDFSTTYRQDSQTFPIRFDRYAYWVTIAVAFLVIPFVINDYWASAVFVPFLIYAIAALGLNILTGFAGQVSLGTGGFMAVGAYACYKLMTGIDIWIGGVQYALPPISCGETLVQLVPSQPTHRQAQRQPCHTIQQVRALGGPVVYDQLRWYFRNEWYRHARSMPRGLAAGEGAYSFARRTRRFAWRAALFATAAASKVVNSPWRTKA